MPGNLPCIVGAFALTVAVLILLGGLTPTLWLTVAAMVLLATAIVLRIRQLVRDNNDATT
ncbi:hypothetical protein [uncultured Microbacterium sp.]|uniref:hypothetical protein n=1 Tax=uncultured Microbacterium sp. TaxID=191216 RepID=UPI00261A5181|nr:hypothetical protein [uncultured Microbacterium sp.]